MTIGIPQYGLKAYALLYLRHGVSEEFKQSELDWIVSESMKKKIFSLLLRSGWIVKKQASTYVCKNPSEAIKGLLEFRVPQIIKAAQRTYAFTQLSAVEIWSDFSYTLRGIEKSPYFVKVLKKDINYWKGFFSKHEIPYYIGAGAAIGEYVILMPVASFSSVEKDAFKVESLKETVRYAKLYDIYEYAVQYMKNKYGAAA
jgi:hypothetical protein